jgi:hypothetical protein
LWPDELRGVVSPRHLALVRKPLLGRPSGQDYSHVLATDEESHEQILAAFEQGLTELAAEQSTLKLMLAGSLARYALTMPVSALLSVEEETALARQAFVQRYGDASQSWTVRHQVQGLSDPFICSAVETAFLDKLKMLCQTHKIQLAQAEPLLAVAWRKARHQLPGKANWLAVTEPGRVHLISLHNRAWINLASARTHGDWESVLVTLLQREASVLDGNENEAVWLMSAEPGLSLPSARPWRWLTTPQSDAPYLDFVLG